MKIDKARSDLINLKKDAEAATLQAMALRSQADEQEKLASALRQRALILEEFVKTYCEDDDQGPMDDQETAETYPDQMPPSWATPVPILDSEHPRQARSETQPIPPRAPRTKVTPEILASILSMKADGVKILDIANRAGVSVATVSNYLRANRATTASSDRSFIEHGEAEPNSSHEPSTQPNMLESY